MRTGSIQQLDEDV